MYEIGDLANLKELREKFVDAASKVSYIDSLEEFHQLLIDMMDIHEQDITEDPIIAAFEAFEKDSVWIVWRKKNCEEK